MKKHLLPPLTFAIVTLLWLLGRAPVSDVVTVEEIVPKVLAKPLPLPVETVDAMRVPASAPVVQAAPFAKEHHRRIDEESREFPGLPADLRLATNLYSISVAEFAPHMGEVVTSDEKTVTFRSDLRPTRANFMAVDPANNRVYPIAPTVKINNVSEQIRSALLNEGLVETYYNEDLRVMFVESSQQNVLEVYSNLAGLKLEAELEVIRGFHRAR